MKPVLGIALLASLGLSGWLALQSDSAEQASGVVLAPRRGVAAAGLATAPTAATAATVTTPATAAPPASGTAALPARAADWPAVPAAALSAWGTPRTAPAVARAAGTAPPPPAPERPPAPAFPYQWIGTLDDGHGAQALLGGPLRGAAVRAGQVLDGQWRVERIGPQQLDLTWLPGAQRVAVRSGMPAASPARSARPTPDNAAPEADPEPAS